LASYIFQATLATLLHRAARELARRVEGAGPQEPPRKLLCVAAALEAGGGVSLQPPPEAFDLAIRRLWEDALGVVDALPPLEAASPKLRAAADAGGGWRRRPQRSVSEILSHDRAWLDVTSRIAGTVDAQLSEALAFARHELHEPCSKIRRFGAEWHEAAYAARAHSLGGLSEDMEHMRTLQEDLAKCRTQRVVGAILLDGRGLRDSLAPVPERALGTMKQALTTLARDTCVAAYRRFDVATRSVDERPEGPSAFAAYSRAYEEVAKEQNSMEESAEEVRSMYELLGQFGVRITLEDKVQVDLLHSKERDLTNRAMLEARLFLDRNPLPLPAPSPAPNPVSVTVTFEDALETTAAATLELDGGLLDFQA